jgi:hypothetical protein
MPPQPVLELHHAAVGHPGCRRCLLRRDPALGQKRDEPAYAPHVLTRKLLCTTSTWASASVSRKAINDGLFDVGDCDPGLGQPVHEVAGCMVEATHRQVGIPLLREIARELRHQRGEITCHHELPAAAVIVTRAAHSCFPSLPSRPRGRPRIMRSQEAGASH